MATPPKFNIALKNGGWKTTFPLGRKLFRGELLNFWEGNVGGLKLKKTKENPMNPYTPAIFFPEDRKHTFPNSLPPIPSKLRE